MITKKRILIGLGLIAGTAIVCKFGPLILLYMAFSGGGFQIPVQDCGGLSRAIKGRIYDTNGRPIANALVKVQSVGYSENPERILASATTDNKGTFETGKADAFGCDSFHITVSANGYETIELERGVDQDIPIKNGDLDIPSTWNVPDLVIVGKLKKLP